MNFNSYFTIKPTSNLRILLLTLFFIVPLGTIYGPVSYTHLDVYKRQLKYLLKTVKC